VNLARILGNKIDSCGANTETQIVCLPDHAKRKKQTMKCVAALIVLLCCSLLAVAQDATSTKTIVRFATFNASLNRNKAGELIADLTLTNVTQIANVAEIIQRIRPHVLLINEFDYDEGLVAARLFQKNYLSVARKNDTVGIAYPYVYVAPSNTGIPSGVDFDGDNNITGPNDAYGFGFYPGQYGMVVLSQYPIVTDEIRTFQRFLWKDMPNALLPVNPKNGSSYYSDAALKVFRLSSKSHWDVPIKVNDTVIHFLVSHPTPPVFDGDEDRNGRRNYDEIRFWKDYINQDKYMYDDKGIFGGLAGGKSSSYFVIAGDQNSDPNDGDSVKGAAQLLLDDPLINGSVVPTSKGGPAQAKLQAGVNVNHTGDPALDTADFGFNGVGKPDVTPGNLRVDYVLPSAALSITDAGIFWPAPDDKLFPLAEFPTSDHRLVWVDIAAPVKTVVGRCPPKK
jgi:3-phytase